MVSLNVTMTCKMNNYLKLWLKKKKNVKIHFCTNVPTIINYVLMSIDEIKL